MAKNTAVHVVDDLTGEPAAETVGFGLDGLDYEIDLSAHNAAALREIFDPYVRHGRRTGGRKQSPRVVPGAKAVVKALEPQEVPANAEPTAKAKPAKRTAAAAKTAAPAAQQVEPAPKATRAKKDQPAKPQAVKSPAGEPKTTVVKTTEPAAPKTVRRPAKKIPAVTFSSSE